MYLQTTKQNSHRKICRPVSASSDGEACTVVRPHLMIMRSIQGFSSRIYLFTFKHFISLKMKKCFSQFSYQVHKLWVLWKRGVIPGCLYCSWEMLYQVTTSKNSQYCSPVKVVHCKWLPICSSLYVITKSCYLGNKMCVHTKYEFLQLPLPLIHLDSLTLLRKCL